MAHAGWRQPEGAVLAPLHLGSDVAFGGGRRCPNAFLPQLGSIDLSYLRLNASPNRTESAPCSPPSASSSGLCGRSVGLESSYRG